MSAPRGERGFGEESVSLGARIREERDRLGLSLRELARRLDVSPSLVSQIENGKTQPSVRTLYAIVSELGVSLDEIFAPSERAAEPEEAVVSDPSSAQSGAVRIKRGDGRGLVQRGDSRDVLDLESGVRWERLTTRNDPDVDFLYTIYEVGGSSSTDDRLVRHNGREFGIVVRGQLGVRVGFEEHVLNPGDSISFDSTVPHRLHNDSDEAAHAIWVVFGRHHGPEPRNQR